MGHERLIVCLSAVDGLLMAQSLYKLRPYTHCLCLCPQGNGEEAFEQPSDLEVGRAGREVAVLGLVLLVAGGFAGGYCTKGGLGDGDRRATAHMQIPSEGMIDLYASPHIGPSHKDVQLSSLR